MHLSNHDLADLLIEKKIVGVDLSESMDKDQREIVLHLHGGALNDGPETVVIRAFENHNYHSPARLSFETR